MSKTSIAILVVIVVVVAGYFIFSKPKSEENQNTDATAKEETNKKMAFGEFLKQGGPYKCEVNQTVDDFETKGTTYVNNGMIRGEYNTKVEGVDMTSIMIIRDGYTYSWTSTLPTGFKIKNEVNSSTGEDTSYSGTYGYASQIGDYNCVAWSVDQSKFTVPTNVNFQEITPK